MACNIVHPGLSLTNIRSRPAAVGTTPLTGRWFALDSTGRVIVPGTQRRGLYLAIEGVNLHVGSPTEFGSSPFASTNFVALPASVASGECALAYGAFVYTVGPEGCDPTAALTPGTEVASDAFGRLVSVGSEDTAIGMVEARTVDGSSNTLTLTVRTYAK